MNKLLNVSASPHTRSFATTTTIMQDVAIALVPASLFGIYNFGLRALLVILTCIATCLLTECVYEMAMKKPITTGDFSAVVTGLLLALNMPVSIPLWIPALGSIFAILVVKMLFGGVGQNFMNPALAARCFLLISFAGRMTDFTVSAVGASASSFDYVKSGAIALDGVSGATPLAALKAGETVSLLDMFLGNTGGTIGETSVIAILVGAVYLLIKKVISFRIPVAYLASFAVFVVLFGGKGLDTNFLLAHVCGGGLLLGAFFMATDYATSPITRKGQVVFGVLLGLLTAIFRIFGASAEGVSYAIIICNMLVPLIEKLTYPKAFGKETKANG
ncbi:electron transport complex subunit D [Anaerocolumna cellulosilytica]|uniref:Ion-translocating oxidoreductase complex subunit D n=1 Tax=Anaerocolumna cellulosilytica TaxID=433286 RepID=A0A6S6R3K1_9FIRM|nr:RnfABCDGE type electron transport complex subunit D [Anaerocolumna cellulosilytica]MBB5195203.1 electron transport complex protein RnfD [Anaerocolumna cellulosilytica]BCJ96676.1 electron transport complex subunit D [Anaerocolumna cellulosilytica]